MKQIKLLFIGSLLVMLSACAPKNQLGAYYQPKHFELDRTQYARAYVYFPNHGLAKGARGPAIFFNDKKIVDLYNAGYTEIYVKPGTYDIHTSDVYALIANQFDNKRISAKLDAGRTYYFAFHTLINKGVDVFYASNGITTPTIPANLSTSEIINLTEAKAISGLSLCHYEQPAAKIIA